MGLKIVHISDTHLQPFPELPEGDILVHSGDALNYGLWEDLVKFRQQLEAIKDKYKHIIFVPGNHDWSFETDFNLSKEYLKETIPNIIVLHNEALELEGFKFYGTADQPEFCSWAFNCDEYTLTRSYSNIPNNTEILITHCPAKGLFDSNVRNYRCGSKELADKIPDLKNLKLHCFGHIHESYDLIQLDNTWYSNAAICNEYYKPVNKPNIIELTKS